MLRGHHGDSNLCSWCACSPTGFRLGGSTDTVRGTESCPRTVAAGVWGCARWGVCIWGHMYSWGHAYVGGPVYCGVLVGVLAGAEGEQTPEEDVLRSPRAEVELVPVSLRPQLCQGLRGAHLPTGGPGGPVAVSTGCVNVSVSFHRTERSRRTTDGRAGEELQPQEPRRTGRGQQLCAPCARGRGGRWAWGLCCL